MITKTLGSAALQLFAGVVSMFLPIPAENQPVLIADQEGDPVVGHALSSAICELYHRYGMFLVQLTATATQKGLLKQLQAAKESLCPGDGTSASIPIDHRGWGSSPTFVSRNMRLLASPKSVVTLRPKSRICAPAQKRLEACSEPNYMEKRP